MRAGTLVQRSTLAEPPRRRGRPPKPKFEPPDLKRCQATTQAGSNRGWSRPATATDRCAASPVVVISPRVPSPEDTPAGVALCAACCEVYKKRNPGKAWFRGIGEALLCPFCAHRTSGRDVALDVLQLEPEEDWETTCPSCKERFGVDVEFAFTVRPLEGKASR